MAQEFALTDPDRESEVIDLTWRGLYKIGGAAALICFSMYLITLAIYVPANLAGPPPETVLDWFAIFEESPVIALFFLGLGDIIILIFWGPMALALFALLRPFNKTWVSIAAPFAFVGMAVFLASNPAFSMLSLSQDYAAASMASEKTNLLAAGQAMLAISRGAGLLYVGMPLVWLAGVIYSAVMLRSATLSKATAWVGIIGFGFLLVGIPFGGHYTATESATAFQSAMVALQYIVGGILSMTWYLLVSLGLLKIARQKDAAL